MLKDVKTNTKLLFGFGAAAFIALALALVGRQALNANLEHIDDIGKNRMPSLYGLEEVRIGILHVSNGYRGLVNRRMIEPSVRQANYDELAAGFRQAAEGRRLYESLPMAPEEVPLWRNYTAVWEEFQRHAQAVVDVSHEKDSVMMSGAKSDDPRTLQLDDRAFAEVGQAKHSRFEAEKALNQLVTLNDGYGKTAIQSAEAAAGKGVSFLMTLMLIGIGLAIGIGVTISRSIQNAVNGLRREAARLAEAAVAGQLSTRADVTAVPAEFRSIVQGVNDTLDAVINPLNVAADYVDKISKGNIPPKIVESYNGDFNFIKNNLNQLVDTLSRFNDDMSSMSKQHDAGEIDARIAEEKFEGTYRVMAKGVNDMVFGHIAVKKKAMACIAEFGRGNFEAELEKFPGKKAFINENIERLRTNIKAFIHDMAHMSKEHDAGDIDIRVPEEKFEGSYRVMSKGVNDMVFGHIAVKKKAMA